MILRKPRDMVNKTKISKHWHKPAIYKNEIWLRKKYLDEKLTIYEISKQVDCSVTIIYRNLVKYNIPRRKVGVENWSDEQKEYRRKWNKNHPEIKRMKDKKHSIKTKINMSLNRRGKNNGNWKGGLTLSIRLFRKSRLYQKWRRTILKRNNNLCQIIGCMEKSNIVHHILPVKFFPELRLSLNNGITICKKHHNMIHKKKGCKLLIAQK